MARHDATGDRRPATGGTSNVPLFAFPDPPPADPRPLRWHRRVADRIAGVVAGRPRTVLAVVAVVVIAFGFAARDLHFEPARFSSASDLAARQDDHRARWGADDGLLVAVLTVPEPSAQAVDLVSSLTDDAAGAVPGAHTVRSATNQPVVGSSANGPGLGPAFGPRSPFTGSPTDRAALARSSRLGAATLVSADARTFAVAVDLDDAIHAYDQVVGPAEAYRRFVEDRVAASGLPVEVDFAGVAYTHVASVGQTQHDLARLLPLAALIMTLILWLALRSLVAVLATLASALGAIVVTAGVIGLLGHHVNQVTPVYPVLLMAVVVSGATHLVGRYFAERRDGESPADAAHRTVFEVGPPAFACAITTASGFASLALADITALREFGIEASLGVAAAFVLQLSVIPAVLVLRGADAPAAHRTRLARRAHPAAGNPVPWTRRYAQRITEPSTARAVVTFGVVLCLASVLIARTARYDYRAADALGPNHPITVGNAHVNDRLGGILPLDIGLSGPSGSLRQLDTIQRLDQLSSWLDQRESVHTLGLPALLREQNRALTGRDELPASQAALDAELAVLERVGGEDLRSLVDADYAHARLRAVVPDRGAQDSSALVAEADRRATDLLAGTGITAGATGEAVAAYDGMIRLTAELVAATLAAMVIIIVTVLLLFRSLRLALVAFLPNAFPIVVGFAGYRLSSEVLDPLPSVVFCIVLGLAADDTIHLISRWRELDRAGGAKVPDRSRHSLIQALGDKQRAMVSSTLVLTAGFAVLLVSDLDLTRRIGGLGTYLLIAALLADLVFGVAALALLARGLDRRRVAGRAASLLRAGPWSPIHDDPAPTAPPRRRPAPAHASTGRTP